MVTTKTKRRNTKRKFKKQGWGYKKNRKTTLNKSPYKKPHFFYRSASFAVIDALQASIGASGDGSAGLYITTGGTASYAFVGENLQVTVAANTTGYLSIAFSPMLRTVSQSSEYTSLFDMYKILGFNIKLYPIWNNWYINTMVSAPVIHSCIDLDDNNAKTAGIAGVDALRQYTSYKWRILNGSDNKSTVWKTYVSHPGVKMVTGSGQNDASGTQTSVIKRSPMLDCALFAIQHHGAQFIIVMNNGGSGSAATYAFDIESKIWMSFHQPR